ncbi:MAG: cupredoxin family copper-binding protein [Rudaea sp.]
MAATLALAAMALVAAGDGHAADPTVTTVTIDGFAFHPAVVTIKAGATIVWRNTDPVPHTATARDAGLDSGEIPANGSYRFVASKKGRFAYVCTFHPIMRGTLVVE